MLGLSTGCLIRNYLECVFARYTKDMDSVLRFERLSLIYDADPCTSTSPASKLHLREADMSSCLHLSINDEDVYSLE